MYFNRNSQAPPTKDLKALGVDGKVHSRKNESISVDPVGVLGVEVHDLLKEDMGSRGQAHRGSGVTGVGRDGGIDLVWHEQALAIEVNHSCRNYFSFLTPLN